MNIGEKIKLKSGAEAEIIETCGFHTGIRVRVRVNGHESDWMSEDELLARREIYLRLVSSPGDTEILREDAQDERIHSSRCSSGQAPTPRIQSSAAADAFGRPGVPPWSPGSNTAAADLHHSVPRELNGEDRHSGAGVSARAPFLMDCATSSRARSSSFFDQGEITERARLADGDPGTPGAAIHLPPRTTKARASFVGTSIPETAEHTRAVGSASRGNLNHSYPERHPEVARWRNSAPRDAGVSGVAPAVGPAVHEPNASP